MSQAETVSVRYLVSCGKHTPDSILQKFEYSAEAPASLCAPHSVIRPPPDEDATGVFIASLIDRHHDAILRSQQWRCVTCGKPATELLHSAVPLLSPGLFAAADFVPTIVDNAAPICMSGGVCDREAEKSVHEFAGDALVQRPWQVFEKTPTCDKCGKKSGLKLCGGCKFIS